MILLLSFSLSSYEYSNSCHGFPQGFGSLCVGDSRLATEKVIRALMRASLGHGQRGQCYGENMVSSFSWSLSFFVWDLYGNYGIFIGFVWKLWDFMGSNGINKMHLMHLFVQIYPRKLGFQQQTHGQHGSLCLPQTRGLKGRPKTIKIDKVGHMFNKETNVPSVYSI